MRPFLPILALVAGLATACMSNGGWWPEQGQLDAAGGAESIFSKEPADATGEGGADEVAPGGRVGEACAAPSDCVTGYCMTTANIGAFIKGAEVPGGYCSALFCAVDGSDGQCTDAMGGVCFSLYPFLGAAFGSKGICLAPCDTDADCRTADANVCFDAASLVAAGLMDAGVLDAYYAEHARGCLPGSVADAAKAKLEGRKP